MAAHVVHRKFGSHPKGGCPGRPSSRCRGNSREQDGPCHRLACAPSEQRSRQRNARRFPCMPRSVQVRLASAADVRHTGIYPMAKVLVLYYSSYGHIETMAKAVAEGAREAGAEVDIKRVPETAPRGVAQAAHFKLDQEAPVATVADLDNYDAIIVGTGTRFGRITSQMASLPRSGRRPVGARRPARQGRRRLHLDRHPARRPGNHAVLDHHQPAAFRHGRRRPGLWPCRADDAGRDHRRLTLRRHDHRRRRRIAPARRTN